MPRNLRVIVLLDISRALQRTSLATLARLQTDLFHELQEVLGRHRLLLLLAGVAQLLLLDTVADELQTAQGIEKECEISIH